MRLTEHVYQLSGVQYGTNSNSYVIDAGDQLILIDAGFSQLQWNVMFNTLKFWNLDKKPLRHVFFTHGHFDHAGNAYLAKAAGMKLYAGKADAEAMEKGDERCIGHMFNKVFTPCRVDQILHDGEVFQIGDIELHAIAVPGHSEGSFMFRIREEKDCLFMGDFIAIEPAAPEDDVRVLLAWTGGPDYNRESYLASLKKASEFEPAILFPGHYYTFYGDSQKIFKMAYETGLREL